MVKFFIFNGTMRRIDNLKTFKNGINTKLQLTAEVGTNNEINLLDLTLAKHNNRFCYKIYRKPTATDSVIHAKSYHPYTQKMATFNSLLHRLTSIPLLI